MTARTRQRPTETPAVAEEKAEAPAVAEEKAEAPAVAEEKAETMDSTGATASDPFAALNSLPDAEEVTEFRRGPDPIDYEKITPLRIKNDLQRAFDAFEFAKDNEGNVIDGKPGKSKWFTQKFPTTDMALQYRDFAVKYAKFREWTFRSTFMEEVNGTLVATKDKVPSKILRFTAKPKEIRGGSGNRTPRTTAPSQDQAPANTEVSDDSTDKKTE